MAVEAPFKIRSLTDDLFGTFDPAARPAVVTIGTAFGTNQFLEYGADSATMLNRERIGNTLIRSIYIMKMRGSKIANSIRVLDISDDGISVSTLSPYPEVRMIERWIILAGEEAGPVSNKMGGIWNVVDAEATTLARLV